jgi:hypothetical protein
MSTAITVKTTQTQESTTSSILASEKWCAIDFEFIRSSKEEEGQRQRNDSVSNGCCVSSTTTYTTRLVTAAFRDYQNKVTIHDISQYDPCVYHEYRQKAFLYAIKNKIQSYNLIFGWASRVIIIRVHKITCTDGIGGVKKAIRGFDSDFAVLDQNLRNEVKLSFIY